MSDSSPRPVWLLLVIAGAALVVLALLVDLAGDPAGGARTVWRGLALVGAVLVAVVAYQRWSTVDHRTPPLHALAGAALLGGALVASSAISASSGVFGSRPASLLGVVALVVAAVAGVASARETVSR